MVFIVDPTFPAECAGQTVLWNPDQYKEPPIIQGFIPGVGTFNFNRPNAARLAWEVNHREGTQFVLLLRPEGLTKDRDAITSPLITITGKGDKSLDANSRCVTGAFTSPTATPTVITSLPETAGWADNIYQVSPPVVRCTTPSSTMWPQRRTSYFRHIMSSSSNQRKGHGKLRSRLI